MKKVAIATTLAAAVFAGYAGLVYQPAFAADSGAGDSLEAQASVTQSDDLAALPIADAPGGHDHDRMKLTDDQLEKIHAIKMRMSEATASKRSDLMLAHKKLHDLMTQTSVNRAEVTALQNKINGLRDDLSNTAISYKLDSMDVLTSDQRQELRHRYLKHADFGGHHRGHGGFGHHGGHGGPPMHRTAEGQDQPTTPESAMTGGEEDSDS